MLILRTFGVLLVVLGFAALAYDGAGMLASPGVIRLDVAAANIGPT